MELDIAARDIGSTCVLALSGEVDVYTAPRLKQALVEAIDGGCSRVVVDLGQVTFMDSSGLGALVSGLRRIKDNDGSIELAGAREPIVKVFEITGLDKVFPLFDTVEAAL